MNDLTAILLLTTLGSLVALVGGVVLLTVKRWNKILTTYSVPFAAGVLLTTAFLGMMPEALDMVGEPAFLLALVAFVFSYVFETLFFDLHHHDCDAPDEHHGKSLPLLIAGDTIHNFIDGVAITATYLINPGLGVITAISTFLHEVPHEIGDFGIMLKSGYSKQKVFLVNFLSALSSLLGVLVIYFLIPSDVFSGKLLAIAAGMFLYLGASDFLPEAHRGMKKTTAIMVFLLGSLLMYAALSAIPHSH